MGEKNHTFLWRLKLTRQMEFRCQFSSVIQSRPALCDPMNCSTPGLPVHHQLLEFTQTHVHWVSDAMQPSHPLSSPSPAFNLSQHQGLFQWVRFHIRWPKYWSFSTSPSHEYSGLISFRTDEFALPAIQGTLKSLLLKRETLPPSQSKDTFLKWGTVSIYTVK